MAKYNKEIVNEICRYIKSGNNQRDSAILSNITEETFYKWKREKAEFSESLKRAERECKARNIAFIQKAAEQTWTAAAWWLERKYKDEFAVRSEHTGKDGESLQIVLDMPK